MKEIRDFLSVGKSICPFAQTSHLHFVESPCEPQTLLRTVNVFSNTLGSTPAHALVVATASPAFPSWSFNDTHAWAIERFLELFVACAVSSGAAIVDVMRHAEKEIRPMFEDSCPTRPILGLKGQPLFSICMAPVYPETHPRYAPRPIAVVTWGEDVASVQALPKVLTAIREKMTVGHGSVYDADELMVPWPTREVR